MAQAVLSTGSGRRRERDGDPLAAVLSFGSGAVRTGLILGFGLATLSHGAFGVRMIASPTEMHRWALGAQQEIHAYLWSQYDVEVAKPEEKKPEPPKPEEKKEEVEAVPTRAVRTDSPPPAAAQAGKILTAPNNPGGGGGNDEPVEFNQGDGPEYAGGVTPPGGGSSKTAVYDRNAHKDGVPNGSGTGPPPPPPPPKGPDQTRAPSLLGGTNWNCAFPPEADTDQVDYAVVTIVVSVREDGTPLNVRTLNDPGHGFGRAARLCALGRRYSPALDRDGKPVAGTMPPLSVTFTR